MGSKWEHQRARRTERAMDQSGRTSRSLAVMLGSALRPASGPFPGWESHSTTESIPRMSQSEKTRLLILHADLEPGGLRNKGGLSLQVSSWPDLRILPSLRTQLLGLPCLHLPPPQPPPWLHIRGSLAPSSLASRKVRGTPGALHTVGLQ